GAARLADPADPSAGYVVSGAHAYAEPGSYQVLITVDDAGLGKQVGITAQVWAAADATDRATLEWEIRLAGLFEDQQSRYTPASYAVFAEALAAARALAASEPLLKHLVAPAVTRLAGAENALVDAVDTSVLTVLILEAESMLAEPGKWVPANLPALSQAVSHARTLLAGSPTEAEVLAETTDLARAMSAVLPLGDKSVLAALLAVADSLDASRFTPASWNPLAAAVASGRPVMADAAATVYAVETAVAAIEQALDNLVLRAAKSGLASAVSVARSVQENSALYQPSSLTGLAEALAAAAAVLADENATSAEVTAVQTALVVKIAAVKLRATGSLTAGQLGPQAAALAALAPDGVAAKVAASQGVALAAPAKAKAKAKARVSLAGKAKAGAKLRVAVTGASAKSGIVVKWYRDGKRIAKAAGRSYKVRRADVGARISVKVKAASPGGGKTVIGAAKTKKIR
ncbi:MAG: FIVAR domain-containing protein, partial [Bifidobacteriaceae bacterium]|nr:FIVAR domain-containing protein [Bifidobacteriaceae bacterium]